MEIRRDSLGSWFIEVTGRLRACTTCGVRAEAKHLLCSECAKTRDTLVSGLRGRGQRSFQRMDHRWLLTWRGQDIFLKRMLHGLKGGAFEAEFSALALLFLQDLGGRLPRQCTLIYPSKGIRDHGWSWAMALRQATGYPIQHLVKTEGSKQALKSRHARESIEFISIKPPRGPLVFVDDIVTTGATAKAAYRALGRPKKMAIWSIFYRPNL